MEIGMHFRQLREQNNLSREQISEGLGLSLGTYKKIEYGTRLPTLDEVKKFSEILDIDPSIFFAKEKTTVNNNGNYNSGKGNLVVNEKELVQSLVASVDKISQVLSQLITTLDQSKK